eukprot:TRINITY_DN9941_c0_g1_i1.p2 TRINITY_DN9941_c0_g1~~TRINITY_DN9941_c0_g1_i1.p2  ORF type:complete len:251 (+),score=58.83 TRINITY_DN9941_c0_g1_i1:73-825(+)
MAQLVVAATFDRANSQRKLQQQRKRRGIAQKLPLEILQLCVDFAPFESLSALRLTSRGVLRLCPAFEPPREVFVRFWHSRVRRRTAMYVPRKEAIKVNGYVTLAGVKSKLAAAAGLDDARRLDGHTLIAGPDANGVGGGGTLKLDSEPLQSIPAAAATTLYLVPPPLESGAVAPLVVIPRNTADEPFLDRSEFHHVAPTATIAALLERHRNLVGPYGGHGFSRDRNGDALPESTPLRDQGLASGGTLYEV